MYCVDCGAPNPEGNNFCNQCGKSLIQPAASEAQVAASQDTTSAEARSMAHPATIIIAICSVLLIIVLVVLSNRGVGDKAATTQPETPTVQQEPPPAGVSLHAYDLLKDPYSYKGKMVVLDVYPQPIMTDGRVLGYSNPPRSESARMISFGFTGVRFARMLSEDQALYDVIDAERHLLGQIAVTSPSKSPHDLAVNLNWDVEPLGSLEGSNALGGTVTVPAVRFWGYTDQRNASQINQTEAQPADQRNASQSNQTGTKFAEAIKPSPLSGDDLAVQNLVRGKIRATKFLLSSQPDLSHIEWFVIKNGRMKCDGCWYVSCYIKVKRPPLVGLDAVAPGNPLVISDWDVNLRTQTVTPSSGDTAKLFDTAQ
jgi:hypothetical protein